MKSKSTFANKLKAEGILRKLATIHFKNRLSPHPLSKIAKIKIRKTVILSSIYCG
jgi:hypothetical protein